MKLYRIFIPKKYNDGTKIEIIKLRSITKKLRDKFGGYTANPNATLPILEGAWIDGKKNRSYLEPVMCIELFCQDTYEHCKWIRAFTEITRQELNQESLFVITQNAEVIMNE